LLLSNSLVTVPWPRKPRAAMFWLPLPGCPSLVKPAERVTASITLVSMRSRMVLPSMISTVAGVSMTVRASRLPVALSLSMRSP